MSARYALLLDGGFVIKKLQRELGKFPNAEDVHPACSRLHMNHNVRRELKADTDAVIDVSLDT